MKRLGIKPLKVLMEIVVNRLLFLLALLSLTPSLSFAQPSIIPDSPADSLVIHGSAEDTEWADLSRLHLVERKIRAVGSYKGGEFKVTDFVIPDGHVLVDVQVKVDSTSPNDGWVFSGQSMSGWRITRLDKFTEYTSRGQKGATFTVEAWARQTGEWYMRDKSWIDLIVTYYYYDVEGVEESVFDKAVGLTLKNVHPIPVHGSAQTLYYMVESGEENIEELILRRDSNCSWGSSPECSDCMEIRHDPVKGRVYSFVYNAKPGDVVCQ